MTAERIPTDDPRMASALAELRAIIQKRHPDAVFTVSHGDDPDGVYLTATIDIEDTDAVVDLVIERLLALQVEESLPLYVIPIRPPTPLAFRRRQTS